PLRIAITASPIATFCPMRRPSSRSLRWRRTRPPMVELSTAMCVVCNEPQPFRGRTPAPIGPTLSDAAHDRNIQVADLLPQGVPVQPEQLCRLDLVPAGGTQSQGDERTLQFMQYPIVQARRR